MRVNGIEFNICAHQMADNGYAFAFAPMKGVITLFSAPASAKRFTNCGAFAKVHQESQIIFVVLASASEAADVKEDVMQSGTGPRSPGIESPWDWSGRLRMRSRMFRRLRQPRLQ
jgi:hypothetical protein